MSYGTAADVAALTRRFTNAGSYDTTTNPTATTVSGWITTVSNMLDVSLAAAGFVVPVTQATCVSVLASVVVEKVADLAQAANTAGRFFTERALASGMSPMMQIRREISDWVEQQTPGFVALGAARSGGADERSNSLTAGVISLAIAECDDDTSVIPED